jgi:superfamily II helicase
LAIERGRYKGQNLEERICSQCSSDEVEDEIHFVTKCTQYSLRQNLYAKINILCKNFKDLDNHNKCIWLLSNEEPDIYILMAEFIINSFNLHS